jgi:hypothetical protein
VSGSTSISAIIHGVKSINHAIDETTAQVGKATTGALRANQNLLKTKIRKNLRNPPRWNQRGASEKYKTPAFKLEGAPRHSPRSGGPGRFSGELYEGVKSKRTPRVDALGNAKGWVAIGKRANNVKKGKLERDHPYFAPAVVEAEPLMAATYDKGWAKAIKKSGGFL